MVNELICFAAGAGMVGLPCFLKWLSANKDQKINEAVKKELQEIIDYCGSTTWYGRHPEKSVPMATSSEITRVLGFPGPICRRPFGWRLPRPHIGNAVTFR